MDQGGSSLGLEPFVRCPVDKLLSMNSVRAFKMIIQLFETATFFARKKTEIEIRFPVAVSCSKNQGGLRGGARFRRRRRPSIRRVRKPESVSRTKPIRGASWGWPYKARYKRPRLTPIEVRSFVMALKKRNKSTTKYFRIYSHFKIPTSNPCPNDLVTKCFFTK